MRSVEDARDARRREVGLERERKAALIDHLFSSGTRGEGRRVTPVGEIPSSWLIEPLHRVAEVVMGHSPPSDTYNGDGQGLPLINGPAEFGRDHPTAVQWTTQPTRICAAGDVLFCVRGNTTGRMNVADTKYAIGRGIAAVRGREGRADTSFIRYVLEERRPVIYNIALAGGSTFPNIGGTQLKNLPVPMPPLVEQQAIAAALNATGDREYALQREAELLDELFQVMLAETIAGRLSAAALVEHGGG